MGTVIVALIAATPATIAAIASLIQVLRMSKPLSEVNAAVNHRKTGEKRLVEMVEDINLTVSELRDDLTRHQAYHQIIEEEDTL